jgi:hypothetical protein
LGGPTRADELSDGRRDWISFVLNVGEKRDTFQGGGTYGYGKAVLYRLSKVGTVLVYSRPGENAGAPTSRLIGIALGRSFETTEHVDARPYTGRHWWGDVQGEHVEPLVGAEADAVATALGLTPFEDGASGTTLVVLDPDLEELQSDEEAARHLADTIAWHAWPLLLQERGDDRLVASVTLRGQDVGVPDPRTTYPLNMFVAAYLRAKGKDRKVLSCGNPVKELGGFALEQRVQLPMAVDEASRAAAFAGVPGDPHHVCLMRSPELVVAYYEGPKPFSTNVKYAGVFRAMDELDKVYARSETPTHDAWVHQQLEDTERRFVKVTFTRLGEELRQFKQAATLPATRSGVPLGAAGNYLGSLIAAAYADQPVVAPVQMRMGQARPAAVGSSIGYSEARGGAATPGVARARISLSTEPRVDEINGAVMIVQEIRVAGDQSVELAARLLVATSDGREDEPPVGASQPRIHSWRTSVGTVETDTCTVQAPATVELWVRPAPDTMTDIHVDGRVVEATS